MLFNEIGNSDKKTLFLGAHLDDIEYGCGGLIRKMIDQGHKESILYVNLSKFNMASDKSITIRRDLDETKKAIDLLGIFPENVFIFDVPGQMFQYHTQEIREVLLSIRKQFPIGNVFFPSVSDIHQDHKTLSEEAVRIFRNVNCFGYEIIRSCYHLKPNLYVELSEKQLQIKIEAALAYKSQLVESANYYFSEELIRSIASFRGGQAAYKYAEAFEMYFGYA